MEPDSPGKNLHLSLIGPPRLRVAAKAEGSAESGAAKVAAGQVRIADNLLVTPQAGEAWERNSVKEAVLSAPWEALPTEQILIFGSASPKEKIRIRSANRPRICRLRDTRPTGQKSPHSRGRAISTPVQH